MFPLRRIAPALLIIGAFEGFAGVPASPKLDAEPCMVAVWPRSFNEPPHAHSVQIPVTSKCAWTVTHSEPALGYVTYSPAAGTGNGVVTVEFSENTTNLVRLETLLIGDQSITVAQRNRFRGADFNRDGKADIAMWDPDLGPSAWWPDATGRVRLYMDGLDGIGGTAIVQVRALPKGAGFFLANFGAEIIERSASGAVACAYDPPYPAGPFGVAVDPPPSADWEPLGILDQSVDGLAAIFGRQASGFVTAYGFSQRGSMWVEPDPAWQIVAAADFDGDGFSDLLWRNTSTGVCFITLIRNLVGVAGAVYHYEPDPSWQIVAAGDANGDGFADVLWRNASTGLIWLQFMHGFTVIGSGAVWVEPDPVWQIAGMADFNGDGRFDLLFQNTQSDAMFGLLLDGTSVLDAHVINWVLHDGWRVASPRAPARWVRPAP